MLKLEMKQNTKKITLKFISTFLLLIVIIFFSFVAETKASSKFDSVFSVSDTLVEVSDTTLLNSDTLGQKPTQNTLPKPPSVPAKPPIVSPRPPKKYPKFGEIVKGSSSCDVCTYYYKIHDGKGGKIQKKIEDSDNCCKCGESFTDRIGYIYRIDCENGVKKIKMIGKK